MARPRRRRTGRGTRAKRYRNIKPPPVIGTRGHRTRPRTFDLAAQARRLQRLAPSGRARGADRWPQRTCARTRRSGLGEGASTRTAVHCPRDIVAAPRLLRSTSGHSDRRRPRVRSAVAAERRRSAGLSPKHPRCTTQAHSTTSRARPPTRNLQVVASPDRARETPFKMLAVPDQAVRKRKRLTNMAALTGGILPLLS